MADDGGGAMSSKHTPGPWSESPDGAKIYGADGVPVAKVAAAGRPRAVRSANSRLIAAAPDMLDALDEILALASAPVAINQNAGERNRHALNLVRYVALAAIKEVRGE